MVNCHFALGAIIMLILFGILFICQLYWNQSMTFMVFGKGVYLQSRYLYCHLVHIWLAKNWRQPKCDEEVYLHWFLMAAASVIIPLFIKGIYLLLLCLVIMG